MYLSREIVVELVSEAIEEKKILLVKYEHVKDEEIVNHKIAPFDIGSSNPDPKLRARNENLLYAYCFTHRDKKRNNAPDPKVVAFDIEHFLEMDFNNEKFDENELSELNLERTKWDYSTYKFALLPARNWFKN
jgi:hypothetical protein